MALANRYKKFVLSFCMVCENLVKILNFHDYVKIQKILDLVFRGVVYWWLKRKYDAVKVQCNRKLPIYDIFTVFSRLYLCYNCVKKVWIFSRTVRLVWCGSISADMHPRIISHRRRGIVVALSWRWCDVVMWRHFGVGSRRVSVWLKSPWRWHDIHESCNVKCPL